MPGPIKVLPAQVILVWLTSGGWGGLQVSHAVWVERLKMAGEGWYMAGLAEVFTVNGIWDCPLLAGCSYLDHRG